MEDGSKMEHDNLINLIKSLHDKIDQLQKAEIVKVEENITEKRKSKEEIVANVTSKIESRKSLWTLKKLANITRVCLKEQSATLTETLSNAIVKKNLEDTLQCYKDGVNFNKIIDNQYLVAFNKSWFQFILESWTDYEAFTVIKVMQDDIEMDRMNSQKKNLLHITADQNLPMTLQLLMEKAKIENLLEKLTLSMDNCGFTPIHYCALKFSMESFIVFLNFGVDITGLTSGKETIITIMGNQIDKDHEYFGNTFSELLQILMNFKIWNKSLATYRGRGVKQNTPLHYVVEFGDQSQVEELVELGALPEKNSEGKTPLHLASELGKKDIIEYLLKAFTKGKISPNLDEVDNNGNTCLHLAVKHCRMKQRDVILVEYLIDEGANLSVKNKERKTPLDLIFLHVQNPGIFLEKIFNKNIDRGSATLDSNWIKSITFNYKIFNSGSFEKKLKVALWSMLATWTYFFSVVSINPHIGTETLIFMKVGKRLMKLLIAYSGIVLGYYFAFALLLPENESFNHMLIRLNTIITMMMGELEVGILPNPPKNATSPYSEEFWMKTDFSAHLIFLCFTCSVSLVVFNILTAFAIKDVQNCLKEAEINKLLRQADYINLVEQSFLSRFLKLNVGEVMKLTPGVMSESKFENKVVSKWQDIIFNQLAVPCRFCRLER